LAVAVTLACPEAFVVTDVADSTALDPAPGAAKVTVAPGTAAPIASLTVTARAVAKAVPTDVLWLPPPETTICAGTPGVLVKEKVAAEATPDAEADTLYEPEMALAVALVDACPLPSVVTVVVPKVALAPEPGAAKVTLAPTTGCEAASRTMATSGAAKANPTRTDWALPEETAMDDAVP
jgi:hypothetical protein